MTIPRAFTEIVGAVSKQPTNKRVVKAMFAPVREAIEELRRRTPSKGRK